MRAHMTQSLVLLVWESESDRFKVVETLASGCRSTLEPFFLLLLRTHIKKKMSTGGVTLSISFMPALYCDSLYCAIVNTADLEQQLERALQMEKMKINTYVCLTECMFCFVKGFFNSQMQVWQRDFTLAQLEDDKNACLKESSHKSFPQREIWNVKMRWVKRPPTNSLRR